jgi:hypothetical protein
VSGTDPLRQVRDTAVERALTADDDARRYFALAGVLHRVAAETDASDRPPASSAPGGGMLAAALTSTVAVAALRSREFDRTVAVDGANAWSPGDVSDELVATGAGLACRRGGVGVEAVASRAGLSAADLRERVDRE